jgi:NAD(P)-dependent dehydrogenase (short-subunit alcohol dehydrogenase family)
MSGELLGRMAVVTGGSGGIGRSILARLREAGGMACSLDLAAPEGGGWWIRTDVREDRSVAAALEDVVRREGRLDVLVHGAGVAYDAVLWKTPLEEWDQVHAVNLRGAFLLLRHGIPLLRKTGGGRIVLIGSINGSRGKMGTAAYSSSKAGLIGLARSAAHETGRFGITVNVIEPGYIRTPLTSTLAPEVMEEAVRETLVGRLTEPDDVARAVVYLTGPGGAAMTGQVLRIDGGQYLGGW